MEPLDTTSLTECLAVAKERSDNGDTTVNDRFLITLLEASRGTDGDGVGHYRPYLVAAMMLDVTTMRVESAPEASFRSVDENIEALAKLQEAEDARLGLAVPQGYEALSVLDTRAAREQVGSYLLKNRPVF